jgi:hypothetical protein
MTFSSAAFIYEVWAFHMVLADTGISQAGILLLPGNGTATDNYELCIYHTSRAASSWPTQTDSRQLPIGGNMTYKGKIFGADIEPFKRICKAVESRAMEAGVTLTYGSDWIEVWEDHMNCADISHILFDRPVPDYSWPSLSTGQSFPISPRSTSFDFDSIPYKAYADHFTSPERRFEYDQERELYTRDVRHAHKGSRHRHDNFRVEYDESESSDNQDYKSASNRRNRRREREHAEEEYEAKSRPVPKKYKYASAIAESVTANAVGDIFSLLFESALGVIF